MAWDRWGYDSAIVQREERERREREAAKEAVRFRVEEDECFRVIRSHVESVRLEGYRRHLEVLCRKHRCTAHYHDSSGGHADWSDRSFYMPHPTNEEAASVGYHELAHILCGECPNDGVVHQRDRRVSEWWHCIACETSATGRALTLAPFTRPMFDRLATGLVSYRRDTPAPAKGNHQT